MSTYDLIKVEKNVNLPHSTEKILADIKYICEKSNAKYSITEENDSFGTLTISVMDGLMVIFMDVCLTKIDNDTTNFKLSAYNASGSKATQATIEGIVSSFLKLVDMRLKGETINEGIIKQTAGGSGCGWIILAIAIIIVIFFVI